MVSLCNLSTSSCDVDRRSPNFPGRYKNARTVYLAENIRTYNLHQRRRTRNYSSIARLQQLYPLRPIMRRAFVPLASTFAQNSRGTFLCRRTSFFTCSWLSPAFYLSGLITSGYLRLENDEIYGIMLLQTSGVFRIRLNVRALGHWVRF